MTKGGKNLIILGVVAILVACTTTGVALAIYHNSGDIYLDRSRPGFLPDEEEIEEREEQKEENSDFSEKGEVSAEVLEEYLEKLEDEVEGIRRVNEPFSDEALSDERLGI